MIRIDGREYGTATEIADRLGPDITPKKVHDWGSRAADPEDPLHGLLDRINVPGRGRGTTYFPLDQAATVEHITRTSTRGQKRQLDAPPVPA